MRKINPETYVPLGYFVLVLDDEVEEKTKGGIILSEQTKRADEFANQFGTVIRKGPYAFTMETESGRETDPHRPHVGDVVNYSKYAGGTFQIDHEGRKYRIVRDDDVIGVVERKLEESSEFDSCVATQ